MFNYFSSKKKHTTISQILFGEHYLGSHKLPGIHIAYIYMDIYHHITYNVYIYMYLYLLRPPGPSASRFPAWPWALPPTSMGGSFLVSCVGVGFGLLFFLCFAGVSADSLPLSVSLSLSLSLSPSRSPAVLHYCGVSLSSSLVLTHHFTTPALLNIYIRIYIYMYNIRAHRDV